MKKYKVLKDTFGLIINTISPECLIKGIYSDIDNLIKFGYIEEVKKPERIQLTTDCSGLYLNKVHGYVSWSKEEIKSIESLLNGELGEYTKEDMLDFALRYPGGISCEGYFEKWKLRKESKAI